MTSIFLKVDPEDIDESHSIFIRRNIHIERPKAPFPGQTFSGQKRPYEFNILLNKLLRKYLNIPSTNEVLQSIYDSLKTEVPDQKQLQVVLRSRLPEGLIIDENIIELLRSDIMGISYSRISFDYIAPFGSGPIGRPS